MVRHRPYEKGGEGGKRVGMGGLVRRHELVRNQPVICSEHFAGEVRHDRLRRKVEVAKHFVGPPATQEANDVGVDFRDEQSRGARGSEGARGYLRGEEAKVSSDVGNCIAERFGDE